MSGCNCHGYGYTLCFFCALLQEGWKVSSAQRIGRKVAQVGGSVHDLLWRTCFVHLHEMRVVLNGLASLPETFATYLSKLKFIQSIHPPVQLCNMESVGSVGVFCLPFSML